MDTTQYEILAKGLGVIARAVSDELFSDVTAEQQIALLELVRALERARDIARATMLAFKKRERS